MGYVRIILYQDKQTNGTFAQGEDVISSGAANNAGHMFQNPANFGRFRVLKDKTFRLHDPSISYDGTNMEQSGYSIPFKFKVNFKNGILVHFNAANGGTVADIIDHSFHMLS